MSELGIRFGVVSVRGSDRKRNADNYCVPGRQSRGQENDIPTAGDMPLLIAPGAANIFVVADGMSGHPASEHASLMAVELIPKAIALRLSPERKKSGQIKKAIRDALDDVNHDILGSSPAMAEFSNVGTTVVLAHFRFDRVYVTSLGNSRAYRLRNGHLERLTRDHSLSSAMCEAGTITREELPRHKFRSVLYLYLGTKDARGGPEEFRVIDVQPGDRFLLATDGLTGEVDDNHISSILASVDDPERAAVMLKDRALANGSKDNVTCLVIHVVGQVSA